MKSFLLWVYSAKQKSRTKSCVTKIGKHSKFIVYHILAVPVWSYLTITYINNYQPSVLSFKWVGANYMSSRLSFKEEIRWSALAWYPHSYILVRGRWVACYISWWRGKGGGRSWLSNFVVTMRWSTLFTMVKLTGINTFFLWNKTIKFSELLPIHVPPLPFRKSTGQWVTGWHWLSNPNFILQFYLEGKERTIWGTICVGCSEVTTWTLPLEWHSRSPM